MNFIVCVVCCLFLTVSSAMASPRAGHPPEGICTRDINPWGHASHCSCNDDASYDERSGLCLQGIEVKTITVQGPVSAGVMAIGGETTGFTITAEDGASYELILQGADQEKLTELSGMWIEIEGEQISRRGIEIRERPTIIVERIAVLE